jgi:dTDP-4-dehydrorhamnose 3,5-epimerase
VKIGATPIEGVLVIEPKVFGDERGIFMETWRADAFTAAGVAGPFVQDNHSRSTVGILRGLHFQSPQAQGKLVRVAYGAVFDVVVDIRTSSPTFAAWFGIELSAENHLTLWAPPGMAHGFLTLTHRADVLYKCTDYYVPGDDRAVSWNDPAIGIAWPLDRIGGPARLSARDAAAPTLAAALASL